MSGEFRIEFPEVSWAERSRLASKLKDSLAEIHGVQTSILRERPDTQDPGTILSIVLSAPAIILVVKAIANWLIRNNQSHVVIKHPNGTIIIDNMKSEDVSKAIEALEHVVAS